MTILEIKFNDDPARQIVTQLGDRKFAFDARYNDRAACWYVTISDAITGEVLYDSLALVLGQDLLRPYNLGIGTILVNDEDGTGLDAGPDDLGDRIKVYWLSADE